MLLEEPEFEGWPEEEEPEFGGRLEEDPESGGRLEEEPEARGPLGEPVGISQSLSCVLNAGGLQPHGDIGYAVRARFGTGLSGIRFGTGLSGRVSRRVASSSA